MAVTVEVVGRRVYLVGLPFERRQAAKEIGCKWDRDRKQWWAGSHRRAAVEELANGLNGEDGPGPGRDIDGSRVYARVRHKGRTYYVIAQSTEWDRVLLVTLDEGAAAFWADTADCELEKRYEARHRYSNHPGRFRRPPEYPTVGSLRRFRDSQRDPKTRRGPCVECGHWGPSGEPCPECGGEGVHAG